MIRVSSKSCLLAVAGLCAIPILAYFSAPSPPAALAAAPDESRRISVHLSQVENTLRARETDALTESQRVNRRKALAWLREYREAGLFPHNHTGSEDRIPVFVDPHGTPCAVGYLLLRSGREDLVGQVAEADNFVRIPELAGDPDLIDWLFEYGLDIEEAAAIQPTYGPTRPREEPSSLVKETVGLAVLSLSSALYNRVSAPRRGSFDWSGALGLVAGMGHVGLGLLSLDADTGTGDLLLGANLVAAGVSIITVIKRSPPDSTAPPSPRSPQPWLAADLDGRAMIGLSWNAP